MSAFATAVLTNMIACFTLDWGKKDEEKDDTLWDADWDDADVTDDFAKQLRFVFVTTRL